MSAWAKIRGMFFGAVAEVDVLIHENEVLRVENAELWRQIKQLRAAAAPVSEGTDD